MSENAPQSISLDDLPLSQLQSIKSQLESEISEMTSAFSQMKQAQSAFRECKNCITSMSETKDKTIMIPLSNSLYVPGKLSNIDSVVVDVGTGYYVEKSTEDAAKYYDGKIEYVQSNAQKIQETVEQKQTSYRGLLDVMQYKITQQRQGAKPAGVSA
ncbi:subunit of tubulin prefoldin [Coemansia sp. RSA 2523]|nr:subunit of tubulin prefoldin [Coemansia sp. RSA 1591]KAJ1766545.1 subunit of tubulin prefoldin [Coemansia sp. RSA 1752]KAJ1790667.1 subunit of tubulin prefoldin [Coemansia sp. RSA 2167]KAJ1794344.1 subunit of tubulin prefoldin [Coemansia sp. RSA 1938]KAJ1810550.1 subunit of tubulin prefoldin [Coemansia sp. RSA 2523]KAJ2133516.1 subunit of tubulin prefoldin [Coemansia sp. RSA 921]KAJ2169018.1 subunit of tubulin prefoldin [Coemansia sp. RSA 562]KAJ2251073.1 subunit of tubulin prefoldin [Coe